MLKVLPTSSEIKGCPHGISSYFYPINENRGIKWFKNKSERDYSKRNQHLAFLSGLAPQAFEDVYSDGFYGYVTESVEMLHNLYSHKEIDKKFSKKIDSLVDELYNSSDFVVDENLKNFGIKNGKLVLVDFGYADYSY